MEADSVITLVSRELVKLSPEITHWTRHYMLIVGITIVSII